MVVLFSKNGIIYEKSSVKNMFFIKIQKGVQPMSSMFMLLAGGLLIIIIAVVIAVVASVVSAVAADTDDTEV